MFQAKFKKLISVLLFSFCVIQPYGPAKANETIHIDRIDKSFELRQAVAEDLDQIIFEYSHMSEQDSKQLLQFPENALRNIFKKAIEKGQMYVAIELPGRTVRSFLKTYVVSAGEESQSILKELEWALAPHRKRRALHAYGESEAENSKKFLASRVDVLEGGSIEPEYELDFERQLLIYFGSALTKEGYRGFGLNAKLLEYAVGSLRPKITQTVAKMARFEEIDLVYGQAQANLSNYSMIWPFVHAIKKWVNDQPGCVQSVRYMSYSAFQPDVSYDPLQGVVFKMVQSAEKEGALNIVAIKMAR